VTDTDATWIREQATKVRAARQVKPIRFRTTEKCPFCQSVEEHTDDCPLSKMQACNHRPPRSTVGQLGTIDFCKCHAQRYVLRYGGNDGSGRLARKRWDCW
jgi:hypothetical protein